MISQTSFEEIPTAAYRLGIWKSRVTVNESKAVEHNDPEHKRVHNDDVHKRPESWQSRR
jgi:hypothetical protein